MESFLFKLNVTLVTVNGADFYAICNCTLLLASPANEMLWGRRAFAPLTSSFCSANKSEKNILLILINSVTTEKMARSRQENQYGKKGKERKRRSFKQTNRPLPPPGTQKRTNDTCLKSTVKSMLSCVSA